VASDAKPRAGFMPAGSWGSCRRDIGSHFGSNVPLITPWYSEYALYCPRGNYARARIQWAHPAACTVTTLCQLHVTVQHSSCMLRSSAACCCLLRHRAMARCNASCILSASRSNCVRMASCQHGLHRAAATGRGDQHHDDGPTARITFRYAFQPCRVKSVDERRIVRTQDNYW